MNKKKLVAITNLFFEIGFLNKIKRSQRKNNQTSVAEHSYRVTMIAMVLAKMNKKADLVKTIMICLFHDLPETRVSDVDLVNRKYIKEILEKKAMFDIVQNIKELAEVVNYVDEFNTGQSIEAKIARDADAIEEVLAEKEQFDRGDLRARDWLNFSVNKKKVETNEAKLIIKEIVKSHSDSWWHLIVDKKNE